MKCLSLKQPYAEPLVSGKKTIGLRSWNTHFRGKFLVHASKVPYYYNNAMNQNGNSIGK